MPPIILFALGAIAAGAIIHRAVKELRGVNEQLDRVQEGRAIEPDGATQKRNG
jgi:hypothetical protein